MDELIVYGIKNCDTVKKALAWLDENKVVYAFHDFRAKGISEDKLREWVEQVGWEALVNRKGMTWRQLDDATKTSVTDDAAAIALMLAKTSVIRRPLLERAGRVLVLGFDTETFKQRLI